MNINVRMTGFQEFDNLLKRLPKDIDRKFHRSLQRKLLKPVAVDMKAELSSKTEARTHNLEQSIGVRALSKNSSLGVGTLVGQRYGIYKGFHAPIIEGGTEARKPVRAKVLHFKLADGTEVFARRTKPQHARPFIEPTIEKWLPKLEKNYPEEAMQQMVKFMKRYIKKK